MRMFLENDIINSLHYVNILSSLGGVSRLK